MNEPNRTEWETRCAFNGFCKKALKFEASNAHRDVRHHQLREVTFSSLSLQEEEQLFTNDRYFAGEEADDKSFFVAGMEITPKLLADAIHALPEEKRDAVLLYYFFDMSDPEIAKLLNLSRSTVQYRRTSSFELMVIKSNNDHDERGLLPYPVIVAATKGDPDAMKIVLNRYEGDMVALSVRKMRDERGNTYYGVDQDIYDRLRARLIRVVLDFKV